LLDCCFACEEFSVAGLSIPFDGKIRLETSCFFLGGKPLSSSDEMWLEMSGLYIYTAFLDMPPNFTAQVRL
jgi:hypothetical protein